MKIEDFRFYDLRGCFETRAALGGATDLQVKAAMAHANGVTPTYLLASLTGKAMEAAAAQADRERDALTKDEINGILGVLVTEGAVSCDGAIQA